MTWHYFTAVATQSSIKKIPVKKVRADVTARSVSFFLNAIIKNNVGVSCVTDRLMGETLDHTLRSCCWELINPPLRTGPGR